MRRWIVTHSEDGSALVFVILLLFLVSGLVAAMVTSSSTDTVVSRNGESAAQAQAAAEAGLNHAIDASRTYLRAWETNNFTDTPAAVSRLLRGSDDILNTTDDGSLFWLPGGPPTPPATSVLGGLAGVSYSARVYDDDDLALGNNWTAADRTRTGEGDVTGAADPTVDHNGVFVVRATGFARDQTRVVVEAVMKPLPWPAIVTNGNLDLNGSPQILGDGGSVHANGNITEVGNNARVEHDVTAVGDISTNPNWGSVQGQVEGGQLPISIPPVNVSDYVSLAEYRLGSNGTIYNAATNTALCTSSATCGAFGFKWDSSGGSQVSHMAGIDRTWDPGGTPNCATLNANLIAAGIATPKCGQGVYYAEGSDVVISGNIGRVPANPSPYAMTILADGSVRITGTPHVIPAVSLPNILIVTNGDLDMAGTANCIISGQARVREQLNLAGTMTLTGQIIVENRWDHSDKVTGDSKVSGSATVTNDRLAVYDFSVGGWRELRR